MKYNSFVDYLGNIVEESRWVASSIWSCTPFTSDKHLHETVCQLLDDVPLIVKEAILRAHPDLAGKLAQDNNLTPESTREQAAAGLSDIPQDKQDAIGELNARYKDKFDFPFVICARENKIESILKGLTSRLDNGREQEVLTGTGEIKKICWYRIIELIS